MYEKIGDCKVEKGKLTFGTLNIAKNQTIPLAILQGKKSGKTCFISGGMHGDEINGPRLVQLLMHSIKPNEVKGTIIFLPLLNKSGFHYEQRTVYEDDLDLNRCFPGSNKSLSYKIAKAVFNKIIKISDFGIDCHDSGKRDVLLPQPRVHIDNKGKCNDGCTLEIGTLLGTKIILQRKGKQGMMAIESFKRLKKPVLTVEIGGGMLIWDDFLKQGVKGIKNILIHNSILSGKVKKTKDQIIIKDEDRFSYDSNLEGLLYKKVKLGQEVHKGKLIAVIHNPINEKTEKIKAKHCGFVFSLKIQDKIKKEETVCSILLNNMCKLHSTKPQRGFKEL